MNADTRSILVWDVPTRLFHWSLAISFALAYLTGDSERCRDIHVMAGYAAAALIAFRLVWGIVGTAYARFASFAYGPRRVAAYLRSILSGHPEHYIGHNPAGGWVIFGLIGLMLLTAATGYAVWREWGGDSFEGLHEAAANVILALVGVHIAGVVVASLLHRENLVRSMITGRKRGDPADAIGRSRRGVGVLLAVVLAVAVVTLGKQNPPLSLASGTLSQRHTAE